MFHINPGNSNQLADSIQRDRRAAAEQIRLVKHLRAEHAAQALMKTASDIQRTPDSVPSIQERLVFLRLAIIGR